MNPYILTALSILLSSIGQLLMKGGASSLPNKLTLSSFVEQLVTNVYLIGGLACYGVSAVLWILGLSKLPLSVAYPMVALSYIVVVVCAAIFFKEPVTIKHVIGLCLIIGGVLVLASANQGG